jgi:hypothetical protein
MKMLMTILLILGLVAACVVAAYGLLDRSRVKAQSTSRDATKHPQQRSHDEDLGLESAIPYLNPGLGHMAGVDTRN